MSELLSGKPEMVYALEPTIPYVIDGSGLEVSPFALHLGFQAIRSAVSRKIPLYFDLGFAVAFAMYGHDRIADPQSLLDGKASHTDFRYWWLAALAKAAFPDEYPASLADIAGGMAQTPEMYNLAPSKPTLALFDLLPARNLPSDTLCEALLALVDAAVPKMDSIPNLYPKFILTPEMRDMLVFERGDAALSPKPGVVFLK